MANTISSNTLYVDATGTPVTASNVKVAFLLVTATGANGRIVLVDGGTDAVKLDARVASSGASQLFDFSRVPIVFANGIKVLTLTNAVATLVYTSRGGQQ